METKVHEVAGYDITEKVREFHINRFAVFDDLLAQEKLDRILDA